MPFTISEPHPTVQANAYTHSGRGGLGNTFRAPTSVTPAAGIPMPLAKVSSASSSLSAPHSSSTRFYAGRGGAGNAYPVSERRGVSLDDEYVFASTVAKSASRGYVGRGGAGNFYSSSPSSSSSHPKKSSSSGPYVSTADKIAQSIRNGVHGYGHGGNSRSNARKASDASSASGASMSSDEGARRSGFWGRIHR